MTVCLRKPAPKLSLEQAMHYACMYSIKYATFWYVRKIADNDFQPYAHSDDNANDAACFYCGKEQ